MGRLCPVWQLARSLSSVEQFSYSEQNMLFLVKLNPELSSSLLEEARATLVLSLLLVAAKKKAIMACRFGRRAQF